MFSKRTRRARIRTSLSIAAASFATKKRNHVNCSRGELVNKLSRARRAKATSSPVPFGSTPSIFFCATANRSRACTRCCGDCQWHNERGIVVHLGVDPGRNKRDALPIGRCPLITFRVSRRRREMYCGHPRLCVCVRPRPHAYTITRRM